MEGTTNLPIMFVSWWYKEGLIRVFVWIRALFIYATDLFSVKICFQTLLAPWKRDQISYRGLSLGERLQVWSLNLASRFIGMLVKLATLITYLIFAIILATFSVILLLFWIFYPALIVYFLIRAFNIT